MPRRLIDWINQYQLPNRCSPLQHQPGDQLVLLDSSWHADAFPLIEQLKREGVGIVSVIYDLIPLTHPQFYDTRLVQIFNEWFDWITQTADGYVAISATVRDQVREELRRRIGPAKADTVWFDYFHLGSELDLHEEAAAVEARLTRLFDTPEPVFLMVSTIEPRKTTTTCWTPSNSPGRGLHRPSVHRRAHWLEVRCPAHPGAQSPAAEHPTVHV